MNKTVWIIIAIVCVIGLGGLIAFTKKDSINVDNINAASIIEPTETTLGDNIYGNKNAKVIVFEYADYQCAGCSAAHTYMDEIRFKYKDKVAFVFRNFPLTQGHPNALAAATAAEAAGLQGKYWEMGTALFNNREQWVNLAANKRGEAFVGIAGQIGLNTEQFKKDLSDGRIQTKIQTDRAIGSKVSVNATPSFFINAKKVESTIVEDMLNGKTDEFVSQLNKALTDAGETIPQ